MAEMDAVLRESEARVQQLEAKLKKSEARVDQLETNLNNTAARTVGGGGESTSDKEDPEPVNIKKSSNPGSLFSA